MKVKSKVWLEEKEKLFFGAGRLMLFKAIKETGSINKAAAKAGMSYRHAWSQICSAQKNLGKSLFVRNKGGNGGGGTTLTKYADELLKKFEQLQKETEAFVNKRFKEIFKKW